MGLFVFKECSSQESASLPEKVQGERRFELPLYSQLLLSNPKMKSQPCHFVCEPNPVLSFRLDVPFSWGSVPLETYTLPAFMQLSLVARFRKHQKSRVIPFTEIYVVPLNEDIFPEDWLLWYLEKQQWSLLHQSRENLLVNRDTLLFQVNEGSDRILGRLSAFQWGTKLWIVASTCLEEQYRAESNAFAIFAGTLVPTEPFQSTLMEWNTFSLTDGSQLLYPNSFESKAQKQSVEFRRQSSSSTWIRFWLSDSLAKKTPESINFSKKTTKLLNPAGKAIKLEQFLDHSQEYLRLEWNVQNRVQVLEMQGPNRTTDPLRWMENKYVLEKLCQLLFSEKKENP